MEERGLVCRGEKMKSRGSSPLCCVHSFLCRTGHPAGVSSVRCGALSSQPRPPFSAAVRPGVGPDACSKVDQAAAGQLQTQRHQGHRPERCKSPGGYGGGQGRGQQKVGSIIILFSRVVFCFWFCISKFCFIAKISPNFTWICLNSVSTSFF